MKPTKYALYPLCCAVLLFTSCAKDEETVNPIVTEGISSVSLVSNQVVDEPISITSTVAKDQVIGSSVEVFVDAQSIYTAKDQANISLNIDPEAYTAGTHTLKISLTTKDGITSTKEVVFSVQRRLITINLPTDMVNQYIINAVVFASKMDGSLITAKQYTTDDRTITLSSATEFGPEEEFMLTFAQTDNGSATGMSTHANLTRSNPGTINLTKPFRGQVGEEKTYAIANFNSDDYITSHNINEPYNSDYRVELNAASGDFTVTMIDDIDMDTNDPEIFYMYGYNYTGFSTEYAYLTLYPPLPDDFVLDKADFSTEGLETLSLTLNSSQDADDNTAYLFINGYWSAHDYDINNFHLIYNRGQITAPGGTMEYYLNTNFHDYRYWLSYQNYYAAGIGAPKTTYEIPSNTLDFTYANNTIDFAVTGTDHILGRIRLYDLNGAGPVYVWDITFDSKTTQSINLPQLPDEMEPSKLLGLYANNELKVSSTELVSYEGILDYGEYLQKVIKDHKDPLKVSGGQELIYKGTGTYHDGPINDYRFH